MILLQYLAYSTNFNTTQKVRHQHHSQHRSGWWENCRFCLHLQNRLLFSQLARLRYALDPERTSRCASSGLSTLHIHPGDTTSITNLYFSRFQDMVSKKEYQALAHMELVLLHALQKRKSIFHYTLLQGTNTALHTVGSIGISVLLTLSTPELSLQPVSFVLNTIFFLAKFA